MRSQRLYVLVSGLPGSGKSTLAPALAMELGLPLLAKDVIKEALMNALGTPETVPESQRLGGAAIEAMLAVARSCPGAVLDSTWFPCTRPLIAKLEGELVEVHCNCPPDLARERYLLRAKHRHMGHLDGLRTEKELFTRDAHAGLERCIEVDTTRPVDTANVADQVRLAASARPGRLRSSGTQR